MITFKVTFFTAKEKWHSSHYYYKLAHVVVLMSTLPVPETSATKYSLTGCSKRFLCI